MNLSNLHLCELEKEIVRRKQNLTLIGDISKFGKYINEKRQRLNKIISYKDIALLTGSQEKAISALFQSRKCRRLPFLPFCMVTTLFADSEEEVDLFFRAGRYENSFDLNNKTYCYDLAEFKTILKSIIEKETNEKITTKEGLEERYFDRFDALYSFIEFNKLNFLKEHLKKLEEKIFKNGEL